MEKMSIGQNISKYRKLENYTQQQLGEILGVTCHTISRWELDQNEPDVEMLTKLASTFNISVDCLIGNSPQVFESAKQFENSLSNNLYNMNDKICSLNDSVTKMDMLQKEFDTLVKTEKNRSKINIIFLIIFFLVSVCSLIVSLCVFFK